MQWEHKGQGLREHRAASVHDHAAALVLEGGQAGRAAAAAPPGIDLPAAAHRTRSAASACSASADLTAKHTECSEDAWEIMMTLMPWSRITLHGEKSQGSREGKAM